MRTPFKRTIVSFCTIFIIMLTTTKISESCGQGYESEDYRVSFFSPSVLGDATFEPFYYTSKVINAYVSDFESDKARNLKIWQNELGSSVKLEDIDEVLYEGKFERFKVADIKNSLENDFNNTFSKALLQTENKAILNYFSIAKENESVNFSNFNVWKREDDTEARMKMVNKINTMLEFENSDFLKQRYAYLQLVNYRYLATEHDKGVEIFNKYFDIDDKDIITAWAIFHLAGCVEDKAEANYLLSLAFDKCDSKKARCYLGFDKKRLVETVMLTESNAEKATIYAMSAMNNPARKMDVIRRVYNLDSENSNIQGLILREINKIEDWLLTSKITGMPKSIYEEGDNFYGSRNEAPQLYRNEISWATNHFNLKNYEKDLDYARGFRKFLEKMLNSTTKNKDFIRLAISHLYFMDDNPQMALAYNNKVTGENQTTKTQQRINEILLLPLTEDITNESIKTKLYQSLEGVQRNLDVMNEPLRIVAQLNLYLSRMYYKKGDVVTAAFLHQKTDYTGKNEYVGSTYYNSIAFFDRYGTTGDIENAMRLLDKTTPTDFEKYILTKYTTAEKEYVKATTDYVLGTWAMEEDLMSTEMYKLALIDLQGTIAFRQDKLEEAWEYFNKMPANYWEQNYYFTEYLYLSPFEDFIWNKSVRVKSNKIDILEDLIVLKTTAETTGDASAYFKLGNAYYNFTRAGNSWMMFSYGKVSGETGGYSKAFDSFSLYPNTDKIHDVYYKAARAKKYYEKALAASNDREITASADLMIAHCTDIDFKSKLALKKEWGKTYGDTNFGKRFKMSCSYVK